MNNEHDIPEVDTVEKKVRLGPYERTFRTGMCPEGQEFVHGYRRPDGVYVDSFCRKTKGVSGRIRGVLQKF